jgi:hypothetical protein
MDPITEPINFIYCELCKQKVKKVNWEKHMNITRHKKSIDIIDLVPDIPIDNLDNLRILMSKIDDESKKLFTKVEFETRFDQLSQPIPNPTLWIYNQDKIIELYKFFNQTNGMLANNSLHDYFKFMVENYPPEFGHKLREEYTFGYIDGALLYRNLMIKHNFKPSFL